MRLVIPKEIPKEIAQKAREVYAKWCRGEVYPRRALYNRNVLTLDVGLFYRLHSKDGKQWELMTHERYNKVIK